MPFPTITTPGEANLGRQNPVYQNLWVNYTGTTIPAAAPFIITGGFNGAIMWEINEANVASGASLIIEGSFGSLNGAGTQVWYSAGFYPIVTNGTTQTTLTRSIGTQAIAQNGSYIWQTLDAYPYMRARLTANASAASISVNVYAVAG